MNANVMVNATFTSVPVPPSAQLTVVELGNGEGVVTSAPGGIQCEPTCAADFPAGPPVTLTATPAGGSAFMGWSGGGCTTSPTCVLTLSGNATVGATFFTAPPHPADYDGDHHTNIAVWRPQDPSFPGQGVWYIRTATGGALFGAWGVPALGDVPVPADYDGDGRADLAVYRASTGQWFILRSSDATIQTVSLGPPVAGDVPVPADYDGDGKVDPAIYRPATGQWFILRSSDATIAAISWGAPAFGDIPVP